MPFSNSISTVAGRPLWWPFYFVVLIYILHVATWLNLDDLVLILIKMFDFFLIACFLLLFFKFDYFFVVAAFTVNKIILLIMIYFLGVWSNRGLQIS